LIFSYFAIPLQYQHRVLFWGILGVIVLRAIMIGLGATLVSSFSWILPVFAVFLIITGVKMLLMGDKLPDIEKNIILRLLRKYLPITNELHGQKFIVTKPNPTNNKLKRYGTPLLVALILIECVDLIFAVDSVPAIFTITLDPYIVYTSNIFAILGLRALYFALAAIIHRFAYLKHALALVLIFIGSKTFIAMSLNMEKFPASISLSVTLGLIISGVLVSLYKTRSKNQ
jgi:tellurite resistance protein TerC